MRLPQEDLSFSAVIARSSLSALCVSQSPARSEAAGGTAGTNAVERSLCAPGPKQIHPGGLPPGAPALKFTDVSLEY